MCVKSNTKTKTHEMVTIRTIRQSQTTIHTDPINQPFTDTDIDMDTDTEEDPLQPPPPPPPPPPQQQQNPFSTWIRDINTHTLFSRRRSIFVHTPNSSNTTISPLSRITSRHPLYRTHERLVPLLHTLRELRKQDDAIIATEETTPQNTNTGTIQRMEEEICDLLLETLENVEAEARGIVDANQSTDYPTLLGRTVSTSSVTIPL